MALIIDENDNVATLLNDINKGDLVYINRNETKIMSNNDIPKGHKIALYDIKKGENVIKYGEVIGVGIENIKQGDYVHTHNLDSIRGKVVK